MHCNCVCIVFHVSSVKASLSTRYSAVVISDAFVHIRDFLEYDTFNTSMSLIDIIVHESVNAL